MFYLWGNKEACVAIDHDSPDNTVILPHNTRAYRIIVSIKLCFPFVLFSSVHVY